jgi:sugar/nucleoside kinase (ribokinase family)
MQHCNLAFVNRPDQTSALVVGALSRDLLISSDGSEQLRSGGGVHHGGITLARLGSSVHVLTRVHPEDEAGLPAPLRAEGAEVLALASDATTTYVNHYGDHADRHELRASSDPITAADVPPSWRELDLVQLSPLHQNDIAAETAAGLHGLKGLDVQGLLRGPGLEGMRALPCFLDNVDVVQVSETDLAELLGEQSLGRFAQRFKLKEMIVTRGSRGATLRTEKGTTEIPARKVEGGDPVGAGDVFLAAYLFLRVGGRGPIDAARGATQACAAKLEHGLIPRRFQPEPADP